MHLHTCPHTALVIAWSPAKALNLRNTALLLKSALDCRLVRTRAETRFERYGAAPDDLVDLLEAALAVLKLAAKLAAHHRDASRRVAHAHGGIGSVDALAAGTGGVERLDLALFGELVERERREALVVVVCEAVSHHGYYVPTSALLFSDTRDGGFRP